MARKLATNRATYGATKRAKHRSHEKQFHSSPVGGELLAAGKIEADVSRVRAAINALAVNGKPHKAHKLKGKKLSAAHRRAIREGIRKAKAAKKAA
jgi:hypothetical protein